MRYRVTAKLLVAADNPAAALAVAAAAIEHYDIAAERFRCTTGVDAAEVNPGGDRGPRPGTEGERVICRICRRTPEEALFAGWKFVEDTLCEECALMKRALRAILRSRCARQIFPVELLEQLRRQVPERVIGHA
jgi:hypothetical protein